MSGMMNGVRMLTLPGGQRVWLMDSISYIDARARGEIVVSGSHGGGAAARYAVPVAPRLVVFNDAGVGKDEAGIAGLKLLDALGIAAAAVSHASARIGEAEDAWETGVLSHVNASARQMGLRPGMTVQEAVQFAAG